MRIGTRRRRGEPHTLFAGALVLCLIGLASCSPSPRVWGDLEIVSDDPGGFRSIRVSHLPSLDSEYSLFLTCWLTPGLGAQHGLEIAYNGSDYQRVFASAFGEHNVDVQVGSESETETWTSMNLEELREREERYAPSFRSDSLLGSAVYRMVLEEPAVLGITIHNHESSVIDGDPTKASVILFHGEFATKGIGQVFENLNSGPCREESGKTRTQVQGRWMHRDEELVKDDLGFLSMWKHASELYPEEISLTAELAPDISTTIPSTPTSLTFADERLELTCYLGWRETKPEKDRTTMLRVHLNHAIPVGAPSNFPDELTLLLDGSHGSTVAAVRLDSPAKIGFPTDDDMELEMALVGLDPVTRSQLVGWLAAGAIEIGVDTFSSRTTQRYSTGGLAGAMEQFERYGCL